MLKNSLNYAYSNQKHFLHDLTDFLKIETISSDPQHASDMDIAAVWLKNFLFESGCHQAEVYKSLGNPVVFGEIYPDTEPKQTILIYGHYDVQPVDPLHLWNTAPFEPVLINEYLFARGASDMKGQLVAVVKAVESYLKENDNCPIYFKFLFEGEEEIGSPNLPRFLLSHEVNLSSDIVLNPDAGMLSVGVPTLTYGLRGLSYFELVISGPKQDLHSGDFGGIVHNPAQVLCEIISKLHDENGKVAIPGFYDHVRFVDDNERTLLNSVNQEDELFLTQTGVKKLWGERGFSTIERLGIRPTLEINGITSGYSGPGTKTIIPASASAKISMRLVPDQTVSEVKNQFLSFLNLIIPDTVSWELIDHAGGPATLTNPDRNEVRAMYDALQTVWSTKPIFLRSGSSIPVVSQMQTYLGIDSILTGFSLPDDNIHSPNERLHIPTWSRGIAAIIHFLYNLNNY